MIAKTISHYKILEKLGEGGMGIVYKAEDTKLDRDVALKFLPAHLLGNTEAKERFIREAKAAAVLNHPHIVTVYEINEHEGHVFIAMEYVDGKSLKETIDQKPMPIDQVVAIADQIAEGLQAAHEKGIVHRDIKPQNILIDGSVNVKILDFGLAKLKGVSPLTKESSTLGTVQYMSPEQARGEEVDARSDIWSLGVVMYEMTTGQLPFKSEYEQALVYSILNEEPPSVVALRSDAPLRFERMIRKSLEKDQTRRYQSLDGMISDLRTVQQELSPEMKKEKKKSRLHIVIGGGIAFLALFVLAYLFVLPKAETRSGKSVAVLPFVDMSPLKDQDYFCDGMTEEIINRLSNISGLNVPARTSVFVFKGKSQNMRQIGKELGVQTVLEGSVRKAGNQLRITAQLINVADNYHLWSRTYDRELKDVFAIQDTIASMIVDALQLKLTSQEQRRVARRPMDNVAAYECYLLAKQEILRFHEEALNRAIRYLQNGIDIIGGNALLYSGMAMAYYQYVNIGTKQEDYIKIAEEYVRKALILDPNLLEAHIILGRICRDFQGNMQEAVRHFKKALEQNPNETDALCTLAYTCFSDLGKPREAFSLLDRFKKVDPLNPDNFLFQGYFHFYNSQYSSALEPFRKYYQFDPENPMTRSFLSWTLACNGKRDEAFAIIDSSAKDNPDNVFTKISLMLKYGLLKNKEKALQEMTPDFQKTCRRDPEWSYLVSVIMVLLEAKIEALDWLENAINHGFINYPLMIRKDPFLENIRSDTRFKELMKRVKNEWEHFEV